MNSNELSELYKIRFSRDELPRKNAIWKMENVLWMVANVVWKWKRNVLKEEWGNPAAKKK